MEMAECKARNAIIGYASQCVDDERVNYEKLEQLMDNLYQVAYKAGHLDGFKKGRIEGIDRAKYELEHLLKAYKNI